jgi:hypothetical protein
MSTTPAAHLARLKVQFAGWSIHAIEPGKGTGYTAQRGRLRLYAVTLGELEAALAETDRLAAHR